MRNPLFMALLVLTTDDQIHRGERVAINYHLPTAVGTAERPFHHSFSTATQPSARHPVFVGRGIIEPVASLHPPKIGVLLTLLTEDESPPGVLCAPFDYIYGHHPPH